MSTGKRWPLPKNEPRISITNALKFIPVPVSEQAVYKWTTRGVWSCAAKRVIKLESQKIGGRVYTSKAAVDRYVASTAEAEDSTN